MPPGDQLLSGDLITAVNGETALNRMLEELNGNRPLLEMNVLRILAMSENFYLFDEKDDPFIQVSLMPVLAELFFFLLLPFDVIVRTAKRFTRATSFPGLSIVVLGISDVLEEALWLWWKPTQLLDIIHRVACG